MEANAGTPHYEAADWSQRLQSKSGSVSLEVVEGSVEGYGLIEQGVSP